MLRLWDSLNPLTEFAIALIAIAGLAFHIRWSRRSTVLGPTLLTTLGIFFCFAGIAWGLLDFDPNNVKAGVPGTVAVLAGIGTGLAIGLIHGSWITKLRIPSFIVTLAGQLAWQGALLYVLGNTGTVNGQRRGLFLKTVVPLPAEREHLALYEPIAHGPAFTSA